MYYGRMARAVANSGASAVTDHGDGTFTGDVFNAQLMLFEKAAADSPSTMKLRPVADELIPVINITDSAVNAGDQMMVTQLVDERWVIVDGTTTPGTGSPWMRFRVLSRGACGTFSVEITQIRNGMAGESVGDTINVHDPNALFEDLVADDEQTGTAPEVGGATGTAYYRTPTTSNDTPTGVYRWEIETCSMPVNQMRVYLQDCLYSYTSSTTGRFNITDAGWKKSQWPYVDLPPEAVYQTDDTHDYNITIYNPFFLTSTKERYVTIRRVTDANASLPENTTLAHGQCNDMYAIPRWEICDVEDPIARWIEVSKNGDNWDYVAHWEGADPRDCVVDEYGNINARCAFRCDCVKNFEHAVGFYQHETNEYLLISTASAMLGEPDDTDVILPDTLRFGSSPDCPGDPCVLTWKYKKTFTFDCCEAYGGTQAECEPCGSAALPIFPETVVTGGTLGIVSCGQCKWEWSNVGEFGEDWVKIEECDGGVEGNTCQCNKPPPAASGTPIGEQVYSDCSTSEGIKSLLCMTLPKKQIWALQCGPLDPVAPDQSCIGLDDECPDPCEAYPPAAPAQQPSPGDIDEFGNVY